METDSADPDSHRSSRSSSFSPSRLPPRSRKLKKTFKRAPFPSKAGPPTEISEESLRRIPSNPRQLRALDARLSELQASLRGSFLGQIACPDPSPPGPHFPLSIPISADIRTFDFGALAAAQRKAGGRLFDAIVLDPPWRLSSAAPCRGVSIPYASLPDPAIFGLPLQALQTDGLLFLWAINAKLGPAVAALEAWGYRLVDQLSWVKTTPRGRLAKGNGFYLQHAKETCLVALKGTPHPRPPAPPNVLLAPRRGQSEKPPELHEVIEALFPGGFFLEIFGRKNNLRDGWVTLGNEL